VKLANIFAKRFDCLEELKIAYEEYVIESLYRADFSFQRLLLFEDKKINFDAKNSSFYLKIEN